LGAAYGVQKPGLRGLIAKPPPHLHADNQQEVADYSLTVGKVQVSLLRADQIPLDHKDLNTFLAILY